MTIRNMILDNGASDTERPILVPRSATTLGVQYHVTETNYES